MKIRKATIKDIKEIAELLREYDVHEHKLDKRRKIEKIKDIITFNKKLIRHPKVVFFVAEVNGKLAGMVSGEYRDSAIDRTGIFHNIIVTEKFRGKGIGKKLLKEIEKYFRKKRCSKMHSLVRPKNKRALKFYKKIGFKVEEGFRIDKKIK
ncbi:GNAT family N-acetyltransferase [Candidatus Woesearchaeota archaeon]|nr:GNAT family N-acetyltransferase [Candidatus Woesearchaeota archaeon]